VEYGSKEIAMILAQNPARDVINEDLEREVDKYFSNRDPDDPSSQPIPLDNITFPIHQPPNIEDASAQIIDGSSKWWKKKKKKKKRNNKGSMHRQGEMANIEGNNEKYGGGIDGE
jgi:hypothetical protein